MVSELESYLCVELACRPISPPLPPIIVEPVQSRDDSQRQLFPCFVRRKKYWMNIFRNLPFDVGLKLVGGQQPDLMFAAYLPDPVPAHPGLGSAARSAGERRE